MNEFMIQVLNTVVIPLLPLIQVLIATLIGMAIWKLKKKIKDDDLKQYLDILQDLVINVVGEINQTAVEALKEAQNGKLTEEQKALYFGQAKAKVMAQLTVAQTKALKEVYNDLDAYINSLIETTVNQMKD